ncbi:hypothetical protein APR04_005971 [Promicromonospora umidemergens]|uniref:Uncharacterized protein n=1 Tax=Promicromonospora umidemergens TaxID=629679 RepID=A0ABP8XXC9_9MICO|nr:hypothetical protein [Promicromonospora umidemergens]MCP2287024.1 hypothetical protein [Promicromonospora umidemergens]
MPLMQVMGYVRAPGRTESQRRRGRVATAIALSLISCLPGGVVGYYTAFTLTYYEPGKSEWIVLLLAAIVGAPVVFLLVVLRKEAMTRFATSWLLVAAAGTYLWTSTTFDYDVRQLAETAEFGAFTVDDPKNIDDVTRVQLTVDGTDAVLEIGAAPDSEPLVLIVAPVPPEYGCSEYGTFGGSPAYACSAPAALQFNDAVRYSWSGAALEAGGVSITTDDTEKIGELPIAAVPVDVTFATYSSFDDKRIFNRPLLGAGAVDQYTITYLANAQTLARDQWTAVVEYRFPRGTALLSMARDLSLILLGGAVSLFLIPQVRTRERQPAPATNEAPSTSADARLRRPEQRSRQAHQKSGSSMVHRAWSFAVALALVTLRRHRNRGSWPGPH